MSEISMSAARSSAVLPGKQSLFMATLKRMSKNKVAILGLITLIVMGLLSVLAPYISKYGYADMDIKMAFSPPSWEHPFGTDQLGRDILSRVLYGGRYSLSIGFLAVGLACSVGVIIGAFSGYYGGKIDNVTMRILDILQAFPPLVFAITIAAALGTGFTKTVIALGIAGIPGYARLMRAQMLTVRKLEYVEAAQSIDCSTPRIIFKHEIPNCISPIIVQVTMQLGMCIIAAAGLSYLGLGVQPPEPEWGALLTGAKKYIRDYSYMIIFPGLAIMIACLSFNMIGDALRDALDPKLKK